MIHKFDFLVIGSGIAGMTYALSVANSGKGKVALVCKTSLDEANTAKAQGGIAAVTNLAIDNFEKHINDNYGRLVIIFLTLLAVKQVCV